MELSSAKVLITGGGKGIGNYIAQGLLQRVEKVIVVDNNQELLEALPSHQKLVSHKCDVTDSNAVEKTYCFNI